MFATPHRPFSQYRRPDPVETLTTRQTSPPRRIVILWRAMLTSIDTTPMAFGLVAMTPAGRGFLVVIDTTVETGAAGVTVVGPVVVDASATGTVVGPWGLGGAVVGGAVVGAIVGGDAVVGTRIGGIGASDS